MHRNSNLLTLLLTLIPLTALAVQPSLKDPFHAPEFQDQQPLISVTKSLDPPIPIETPTSRKIIKLLTIDATKIADVLKNYQPPILSKQAKITVDSFTNSLILQENTDNLPLIINWLKEADVPNQQVQITAHIISSGREALQELGLNWGMSGEGSASNIADKYTQYQSNTGSLALNLLKIKNSFLSVKLNALEQKKLLTIIASPRLMASHNKPASIKQGTEIPYVTSQDEKNNSTVQFKDAVLGMEVTPSIQRNGQISLLLKISHNSPSAALTFGENKHLSINKQEINTSVTIKHGETLILGGIFQQKQEETKLSVPFLADIPLLGKLFINTDEQVSRRELVIFITPHLIDI
ncbi:transporter [Moellerella wisconsensis]|uniref:Transporter n=2 Tax=Moellerella wisconsensis TaxID=158849 RepID=A0ACD3Y841_9GAMM|nr:transporter [Moellerella wisconsensis]UNH24264.1 transporter [Moellerella wisconsensis]UNH27358.1 transporter [Moellerella wisconsensis]UNH30813.1 transporter [Moellerella wisconsensis]UNH38973.1 transporter [Moellerella wisconsensis]